MTALPSYVLVTPVRNEEAFVGKVIENVVGQTILPQMWIIVNDNSIDRTEEIIKGYAEKYQFIEPYTIKEREKRSYSSRVSTVVAGCERLKDTDYNYLGIIDADIEIPNNYYELILEKFKQDSLLGIAGGLVFDFQDGKLSTTRDRVLDHVAGGVQMFRRSCYESISGYRILPWGGDDFVAEMMARNNGWRTRTFPEIKVLHYRATGSKETKYRFQFPFYEGLRDWSLGYHPLYHLVKCFSRVFETPILLGSLIRQSGYIWAKLKYKNRPLPSDYVDFVRKDQMHKIKSRISKFSFGRP